MQKEMGGYVGSAPACYDSLMDSNSDILKKSQIINGLHKRVLGSIPASSNTVESEGLQINQC